MAAIDGLRVSILAPSFPRHPGGGARVIYEHANALVRSGCDVTVVHDLGYATGPRLALDTLKSRARDLKAGVFSRQLRWMSVDERVRLAFVPRLDKATRLPPADLRVGTFWTTTEFLSHWRGDAAPYMQLIQARETWAGPAERVDAVWRLPVHSVVVSHALYRTAIELGVPASRLHLVPNGLDTDIYRVSTPIESRPPSVAMLAHPAPVKGLRESIEVLERVHAARPDVPLVAFGALPRPPRLPAYVAYHHGLSGRALTAAVYDKTSVFLCASQSEGWGYPSMEAMACGAALVSTRNGGVDDFAEHGSSALLRDVGDINGLAEDVVRLIDDPAERERLAAAGAASARRFTWAASGAAFATAVSAAIDDAARTP